MNTQKNNPPKCVWILTPTLGICLFVLLYGLAACQYPGGSNTDRAAVGFSWQHNYWCDLLGSTAKNGQLNTAQPFAMAAMIVLSLSLSAFWYNLPVLFQDRNRWVIAGQLAGILSMILICFISTPYHDRVINVAGGFGLIALLTTLVGLYKSQSYKLLYLGLLGLLLMGLNTYIYYTGHYLTYLPIVQKFSFVIFLAWVSLVTVNRTRKISTKPYFDKV